MNKFILTFILSILVITTFSQNKFTFNLSINTDTVCPGEKVLISINIQSGHPPFKFYDNDGDLISPPFMISKDSSFIFNVTGKDAIGSSWQDQIRVNIYPLPKITIKSDIIKGCQPLTVNFNEETANCNNCEYIWFFGDGGISYNKNPKYKFEDYGNFQVSLELTEPHGGKKCKIRKTAPFTIEVFKKPEAKFIVDEDVQDIITPIFDFENYSSNLYNSFWSFGDGDSSNIISPSHKFDSVGTYNVRLIVESENGCKDTVSKLITVQQIATLYAPNAFTPDNDGINDVFMLKAAEINFDKFEFKVYDRFGHIIFESHDITKGWDGCVYGKRIAPPGVYVYTVVVRDFKSIEYTKSGKITLIR